jgi:hypothetical protein
LCAAQLTRLVLLNHVLDILNRLRVNLRLLLRHPSTLRLCRALTHLTLRRGSGPLLTTATSH